MNSIDHAYQIYNLYCPNDHGYNAMNSNNVRQGFKEVDGDFVNLPFPVQYSHPPLNLDPRRSTDFLNIVLSWGNHLITTKDMVWAISSMIHASNACEGIKSDRKQLERRIGRDRRDRKVSKSCSIPGYKLYEAYERGKRFPTLSIDLIKAWHIILMGNDETYSSTAGSFRTSQCYGDTWQFPIPEHVEPLMVYFQHECEKWMDKLSNRNIVQVASYLSTMFIAIHPFDSGNGRISRLIMNFVLAKYFTPPISLDLNLSQFRSRYYAALNEVFQFGVVIEMSLFICDDLINIYKIIFDEDDSE